MIYIYQKQQDEERCACPCPTLCEVGTSCIFLQFPYISVHVSTPSYLIRFIFNNTFYIIHNKQLLNMIPSLVHIYFLYFGYQRQISISVLIKITKWHRMMNRTILISKASIVVYSSNRKKPWRLTLPSPLKSGLWGLVLLASECVISDPGSLGRGYIRGNSECLTKLNGGKFVCIVIRLPLVG